MDLEINLDIGFYIILIGVSAFFQKNVDVVVIHTDEII